MSDVKPLLWLGDPAHARWLEGHSDGLLKFGAASAIGVGFGNLDIDGQVTESNPAGYSELYVTGRMIHAFSLGALQGRPGCAALVDHGLASLKEGFADPVNGGWFNSIDADGPVDRSKQAYSHAFVLLATSSATVAGRPGAGVLLRNAMAVHLDRFWREDEGMVLEGWDEAWTHSEEYRGVNANMHTVEALLSAGDVTGDVRWFERAATIADHVVAWASANDWRIPEHFDSAWAPQFELNADRPGDPFKPYGATVGHGLEWSRLLLQIDAALPGRSPAMLVPAARALYAGAVRDGWAVDGAPGFVYTTDWAGAPVVHTRMHWVAAEAIGAAAALHQATGDSRYADDYARWWDYAGEFLVDRAHGSWHHELDASNVPSAEVWPGKPDLYHAFQATLLPLLPLAPGLAIAIRDGLSVH